MTSETRLTRSKEVLGPLANHIGIVIVGDQSSPSIEEVVWQMRSALIVRH